MEAVWPDSIVEENNLAQAISRLRQIFGETPGSHSYIVTVPGRGYRFVAEVKESAGRSSWHCRGGRETRKRRFRKPSSKRPGIKWKDNTTFCSLCRTFNAWRTIEAPSAASTTKKFSERPLRRSQLLLSLQLCLVAPSQLAC